MHHHTIHLRNEIFAGVSRKPGGAKAKAKAKDQISLHS
jgi:hypothetical protein